MMRWRALNRVRGQSRNTEDRRLIAESNRSLTDHENLAFDCCDCFGILSKRLKLHSLCECLDIRDRVAVRERFGPLKGKYCLALGLLADGFFQCLQWRIFAERVDDLIPIHGYNLPHRHSGQQLSGLAAAPSPITFETKTC
jgi:hypothetical protein